MGQRDDTASLDVPTLPDLSPVSPDDEATDTGLQSVQVMDGPPPPSSTPTLDGATEVGLGLADPVEDPISVEVLSAFAPDWSPSVSPRPGAIARPTPSQIARAVARTPTVESEMVSAPIPEPSVTEPKPRKRLDDTRDLPPAAPPAPDLLPWIAGGLALLALLLGAALYVGA